MPTETVSDGKHPCSVHRYIASFGIGRCYCHHDSATLSGRNARSFRRHDQQEEELCVTSLSMVRIGGLHRFYGCSCILVFLYPPLDYGATDESLGPSLFEGPESWTMNKMTK
ncbi:hypothetical protein MRX96_019446 [Rhipicephalus microplus]